MQVEFVRKSDFAGRFMNIFLELTGRWVERTPLGTYLGFGGRESVVFGGPRYSNMVMETGSALLFAETGILGGILFPLLALYLSYKIFRRSAGLRCRKQVVQLLSYVLSFGTLFYMKEGTAMISPGVGQLFFWSVFGICSSLIRTEIQSRVYLAHQR